MRRVDVSVYPIVMMASLFWQLLVQMAILSPLGRTLTTAPHTSSLASSNDSPTKHRSCKAHKARRAAESERPLWKEPRLFDETRVPLKRTATGKHSNYRLHPVAVEVVVSLLLVKSHQPSAPQLVPVVLPHWLNAILANRKNKSHTLKSNCTTGNRLSTGNTRAYWAMKKQALP